LNSKITTPCSACASSDGRRYQEGVRKLARQYHPDVAKDKKNAEKKFKEINEAHEVLSDPDKRRKYDELGPNWEAGGADGGGPEAGAPRRGRAGTYRSAAGEEYRFGGTGFSDFFEQFFGARGSGAGTDDPFGGAADGADEGMTTAITRRAARISRETSW